MYTERLERVEEVEHARRQQKADKLHGHTPTPNLAFEADVEKASHRQPNAEGRVVGSKLTLLAEHIQQGGDDEAV